jgi:succinate dehydrogenase / fumarate reductase cytochrome b subunit
MATRPISPHATIYRRMHTMVLSITHRITGVALAVGLALLVYWLMALAAGPDAYQQARDVLGSGIVTLLMAGWLLAFAYHLVNGIRHLWWDTGRGLEKHEARRSAFVVVLVVLLLFALLAWRAFAGGSGA